MKEAALKSRPGCAPRFTKWKSLDAEQWAEDLLTQRKPKRLLLGFALGGELGMWMGQMFFTI